VLEIGTGPYLLLALWLERHFNCSIDACDINPKYVQLAQSFAATIGSRVNVIQSDMFGDIANRYDVVYSNTLYIPRQAGAERGIDRMHESETDWCGGESGYEFIDRLLSSSAMYLKRNGQVLLGFSALYLGEREVRELCIKHAFRIVHVTRRLLNPSRVYHLKHNGTPEA
jgi:release factor glutamine methyltransferase